MPQSYVVKEGPWCYWQFVRDEKTDAWILGLSFLRSHYAVFDLEVPNGRVGIAQTTNLPVASSWTQIRTISLWTLVVASICFFIFELAKDISRWSENRHKKRSKQA